MKVVERDLAPSRRPFDFDDRIERNQRGAKIGRMCRDAGFARAENGGGARIAAFEVAALAGLALVAGAGGIEEVRAARALQEIAADRRGIAQLRRRARQRRLGNERESGEARVAGEVRIADQRADPQGAVGQRLDAVEPGETADMDELGGTADAHFHEIDEIGAAGEKGRARLGAGRDRLRDRARR